MVVREYRSGLTPSIEGLIAQKRACGFSYDAHAYTLERLDRFCMESGIGDLTTVTREMAAMWAEAVPGEGAASRQHRVSALRQLSIHILSTGSDSYVPRGFACKERPIHYIPTKPEMADLFAVADAYDSANYSYMAQGYKVAFRLMYCCGLRISECSKLDLADVDETRASLTIRHSKGAKDRLVYMADDVCDMVCEHRNRIRGEYGISTDWLFPGKDPSRHVCKNTFDVKFAQFWRQTPAGARSPRRPTPHSLRHAFVVNRMNAWMEQGVNLEQMMPYLAAYLGHSSANETFYYYHQVEEAFDLVRRRDRVSSKVIPEVIGHGLRI